MKKVYLARRIPKNPDPYLILNLTKDMVVNDVMEAYHKKSELCDGFIHNGPWILRPPISDNSFTENRMPEGLKPNDVWNMVKGKIESSNVYLGIISSKSYGVIAEAGYACKCKGVAVYILPEIGLEEDDLQDLWFIFQMIKTTEHLWSDEDIKMLVEFKDFNINSVEEYKLYIHKIIPNFMKK